eukprot:500348-Pyramimonas_sp.AAC.1
MKSTIVMMFSLRGATTATQSHHGRSGGKHSATQRQRQRGPHTVEPNSTVVSPPEAGSLCWRPASGSNPRAVSRSDHT